MRIQLIQLALVAAVLFVQAGVIAQDCVLRFEDPDSFHYAPRLVQLDDGSGPALYATAVTDRRGGTFTQSLTFARWNGREWRSDGRYPNLLLDDDVGWLNDLCVFDDGTGPAIYGCGEFDANELGEPLSSVAKWNGEKWVDVGGGIEGYGNTVCVFDDGSGPALFVGGWFYEAGGGRVPVWNIARWDGDVWSDVGGGVSGGREYVKDLVVFDDGSGPALFVGGWFDYAAPAQLTPGIAKWTGDEWIPVGARVQGPWTGDTLVEQIVVHDDGSGPAIYACGAFLSLAGERFWGIARWNGERWSSVGDTTAPGSNWIYTLEVFNDGSGPRLYAGGGVEWSTGSAGVAMWDGSTWHARDRFGDAWFVGHSTMATLDTPHGQELWGSGGTLDPVLGRLRCVSASCDAADCDLSGRLDFFDYLCFQNDFAAADTEADCDGDGDLTFLDFLCFQNHFAAGCP